MRLLDIGAGPAPYRPLFEPHVLEYRTADLPGSDADLDIGPDGRIPVPDGYSDLVISTQVLEHVPDPPAHLRELNRILSPDGLLILSTHGIWMYHPAPGDYWRWTGPGLRLTLESAGFDVVETIGVVGLAASGLQLVQDGLSHRVHWRLRPLFSWLFQIGMRVVDALDPTDRSDEAGVFITVSRKTSAA